MLKKAGILFALLIVLVALAVFGFGKWTETAAERRLNQTLSAHVHEFPWPWPLDQVEVDSLDLDDAQAAALARERALQRGSHLLKARYTCAECHGADFGGGTMVDAPVMGRIFGPNLTRGEGGVTTGYSASDWDLVVRHGLRPDGRPALMPCEEFQKMSDQELSDIITYLESVPPVARTMPAVELGPVGKALIATGKLPLSAELITEHNGPHIVQPPPAAADAVFGAHLAGTCMGCHGLDLTGGPILNGDPNWPAATSLTPAGALSGWEYQDFLRAMREGVRPDGSTIAVPMTMVMPYANQMSDVELRALWAFLQSLPEPSGDKHGH